MLSKAGSLPLLLLVFSTAAVAGPAFPPVPLPAPSGTVVNVSTVAQLQNAVASIASNTTIVIALDNGIVEYSIMEYDTTARDDYTNGVDVHTRDKWIIRHNLFRNIRAPQGALAGPAILMWNASTNTTVDGNTFIDTRSPRG